MSLDINIDRIKEAAKIAGKYYDNKTFNHVVRVVDYPTLIFTASCVTVKRLESKRSLSSCQKILLKMN